MDNPVSPASTPLQPVASVIIPAYNAATTIGAQLEALSQQRDAPEFEVLVCDNGSTDDTTEVAGQWLSRLPTLRLLDASAKRGASAARNHGAREARSKVLLFCDADDVADSDWVRTMTAATMSHGFVAGFVEHALLNPGATWDGGWVEPAYREGFLPWLAVAGSGNMGALADVFWSVDGFDQDRPSGEDADLSWRLQLTGQRLYQEWDGVVHVRKREGFIPTFRQGFLKGVAVHQLEHDYARVAQAFREAAVQAPPSPGEGTTVPNQRLARLARMPRRLTRVIRHPSQLLREWGQFASWLGSRFGRIDQTREQKVPGDVTSLLGR